MSEDRRMRPAKPDYRGALALQDAARMKSRRFQGMEAPLQAFLGITIGFLVEGVLVATVNLLVAPRLVPGAGVVGMSWSTLVSRTILIGWPAELCIGAFFVTRSFFLRRAASRSKTVDQLRGQVIVLGKRLAATQRALALATSPLPVRVPRASSYLAGVVVGLAVALFALEVLRLGGGLPSWWPTWLRFGGGFPW